MILTKRFNVQEHFILFLYLSEIYRNGDGNPHINGDGDGTGTDLMGTGWDGDRPSGMGWG